MLQAGQVASPASLALSCPQPLLPTVCCPGRPSCSDDQDPCPATMPAFDVHTCVATAEAPAPPPPPPPSPPEVNLFFDRPEAAAPLLVTFASPMAGDRQFADLVDAGLDERANVLLRVVNSHDAAVHAPNLLATGLQLSIPCPAGGWRQYAHPGQEVWLPVAGDPDPAKALFCNSSGAFSEEASCSSARRAETCRDAPFAAAAFDATPLLPRRAGRVDRLGPEPALLLVAAAQEPHLARPQHVPRCRLGRLLGRAVAERDAPRWVEVAVRRGDVLVRLEEGRGAPFVPVSLRVELGTLSRPAPAAAARATVL